MLVVLKATLVMLQGFVEIFSIAICFCFQGIVLRVCHAAVVAGWHLRPEKIWDLIITEADSNNSYVLSEKSRDQAMDVLVLTVLGDHNIYPNTQCASFSSSPTN